VPLAGDWRKCLRLVEFLMGYCNRSHSLLPLKTSYGVHVIITSLLPRSLYMYVSDFNIVARACADAISDSLLHSLCNLRFQFASTIKCFSLVP